MGNRASHCCCGCVVLTLGESKFLRLEGDGDFIDFQPGTLLLSSSPVSNRKLQSAGETFLRLSRCGPNEHLIVRLIADAELVNNGTEDEPDYAIGDHLFVELQTPVASGLVNWQLQPLWVIRVGAVVDGDTRWLAQQASPTLHLGLEPTADAVALLRGRMLWDWTDSRKLYDSNGQYNMQTLGGDVELSKLHGNRTNAPSPILPVAYLATKESAVIDGENSTTVPKGSVFRLRNSSLDPRSLASWEIVDREEDTTTRSILMGYGRRGVFNVPTWNALRIEEMEDWPDQGHIGVQCIEDEPTTESLVNATARTQFNRGDGYGFTSLGQRRITATGEPDEVATQISFNITNFPAIVGADLLVSCDLDASAFELAIVADQTIANYDAFDTAFASADANAKSTPPTDQFSGHRINVTDAILAIVKSDANATSVSVLGRMTGLGSATVTVRLAVRYAASNQSSRSITSVGVREVTVPLTSYCVDADPNEWRHTIITQEDGDLTTYPAVTFTPSFDPSAISSEDLDAWLSVDRTGYGPWEFVTEFTTQAVFTSGGALEFVKIYRYRADQIGTLGFLSGDFAIRYEVRETWQPREWRRSFEFQVDIGGAIAYDTLQAQPYASKAVAVTTSSWSFGSMSQARRDVLADKTFTATFADARLD